LQLCCSSVAAAGMMAEARSALKYSNSVAALLQRLA
jgi:hypothetical protein